MAWNKLNARFEYDYATLNIPTNNGTIARLRPTSVRALAGAVHKATRTVSTCLAAISQPDGGDAGRLPHTEGGHLIPLELGGADHSSNLVPMYGVVNRSIYRAAEQDIGKLLSQVRNPAIQVDVSYPPAGDPRIPDAFRITLYGGVTKPDEIARQKALYTQLVPNTRSVPPRTEISGDLIALRADLIRYWDAVGKTTWKLEDWDAKLAKALPPAGTPRPNAWIDHLLYSTAGLALAKRLLAKVADKTFTVGGGWEFAETQRELVILANCLTQPEARKGECWSDAPGDEITTALTRLGTDDGVQIDHIKPKASGGGNYYSNASVCSAHFNKGKGRS